MILAAFLLGALNAGSGVLQMETGVSKYLVQVLQFIIVLVLAAEFSFSWLTNRRRPPARSATTEKDPMTEPPG